MVAKKDNKPIMIISDTGTERIVNTSGCAPRTTRKAIIVQEHDRLALQLVQW